MERAGGRASAARPLRAMDPGYVNPYLQPAFVREKGGSATVILRNRYIHTQYTHTHTRIPPRAVHEHIRTYTHVRIHTAASRG